MACLLLGQRSGDGSLEKEVHQGTPPVGRHPKNTYASETPCVDEHRVYVLFGDLGLYCFDHGGRALWNVPIEPEETMRDYGAAASPVLEGKPNFCPIRQRQCLLHCRL